MPPNSAASGSLTTMAPAGWAIERAMAAVPLSRIAERRAIAPERLADDVGGSQPPALLPPRAGLTRITAVIIRRFIVRPPVKLKRSLREYRSLGSCEAFLGEGPAKAFNPAVDAIDSRHIPGRVDPTGSC